MAIKVKPLELQSLNGTASRPQFQEIGTLGLEAYSGYIQEVYNTELQWPSVASEYNRLWRTCPEIVVGRNFFTALARHLSMGWELPMNVGNRALKRPNDADLRALDFAHTLTEDIDGGGLDAWLSNALTRVPLYGWGVWEAPLGVRNPNWRVPGVDDPWRSIFDDNLVGYRKLAFRHYKSFARWDMDEKTGYVRGMVQQDYPNPEVTIPLDRAVHLTFGDSDNPEGVATLEAVWRLERMRYGYEVVNGIGHEHSAGVLLFTADQQLSEDDKAEIRRAARAMMSAQEGNYGTLPGHVKAEFLSMPFEGAQSILEAIKHYSIMMFALLGMQWVAFSTLSGVGSLASMKDASTLSLNVFNAIAEGFVRQADTQIGKRIFENPVNRAAFAGMTRRPRMVVNRVEKDIDLQELGQFITAFSSIFPLSDQDVIDIRRKTGFMSETLPEDLDVVEEEEPEEETAETPEDEQNEEMEPEPELMTPFELQEAQTLEEKIATMPDYLQDEIAEAEQEFKTLQRAWKRESAEKLDTIPDKLWDDAQAADEANENQEAL